METKPAVSKNMDEYIAAFPDDVQEILRRVRMIIREAAPEAQETISYQIPAFTLKGRYLVYFAGYKKHVSLYPAPIGVPEFEAELAPYQSGKATAKFPLDKPIPLDLIRRMVMFRVQESAGRAAAKGKTG